MNNISCVVTASSTDKVNLNHLYNITSQENIHVINHDTHISDRLKSIKDTYYKPIIRGGVTFDTFTSYSYFTDNVKSNNEYVYTLQHDKYLLDVSEDNLILQPDVVHVARNISKDSNKTILNEICDNIEPFTLYLYEFLHLYFKKLFNCNKKQLNYILNFMYFPYDIHICHHSLNSELISMTYDFIETCCTDLPNFILSKSNIIKKLISLFHSIFFSFKRKELKFITHEYKYTSQSKLTVLVPYHTKANMNKKKIQEDVKYLVDDPNKDILYINNDKNCSSILKQLYMTYHTPYKKGVVFDEFNANSYLSEIQLKSEYVYTCHYRRLLKLPPNIKLKEKTIYTCINFDHEDDCIFNLAKYILTSFINLNMVDTSSVMSILFNVIQDVLKIDNKSFSDLTSMKFLAREIHLCHTKIHNDYINKTYKCIELWCKKLPEHILNKNRIIGFFIEIFHACYFSQKKLQGYEIIPLHFYDI